MVLQVLKSTCFASQVSQEPNGHSVVTPEKGTWEYIPISTLGDFGDQVTELEVYDEIAEESSRTGEKGTRWIAPFIACGDLSAFDSDASYQLPEDYVSLDPVQPPIAPPYKRALEIRAGLSKPSR